MRRLARRAPNRVVLALAAATAVIEAAASIIRHVHLQSGFDLALADQAVWHYSRFESPFSSLLQKNILGDHFSPLVAVLTPLYWLWSDPRMLLIAQAVLISASIIPVFLFAERRLGRTPALLLSGAYAVFWGLQVGALYDFHELAFAPLLIATAILLSDRALDCGGGRHWAWFWVTIALLLAVKEDMAILVVFFGVYLLSRRELRHGIALVILGIAWYELATRLFIPHFSAGAQYSHWTYQELGKNLPDALWALIKAPWRVFTIGLGAGQKLHSIVGLLAPFLFLSFFSRLFILAVPLLAERFLSTSVTFWVAHYHYSLSIAPVLAMAAAAGLGNLTGYAHVVRRGRVIALACGSMLLVSLLITRLLSADAALSEMSRPNFYRAPSYAQGVYEAIGSVPGQASLATVDYVLPHVSQRRELRLIEPASAGRVSYLITNVLQTVCCATGNASYAALGRVLAGQLAQMQPIFYKLGWVVAARPPPGRAPGDGVLIPMPHAAAAQVRSAVRAILRAYSAAGSCIRSGPSPFQASGGCLAAPLAATRAGVNLLDGSISASRTGLRGGCGDLAQTAGAAAHRMLANLSALASFAGRGARTAFSQQLAATIAQSANLDLAGELGRFALLCTPRPSL